MKKKEINNFLTKISEITETEIEQITLDTPIEKLEMWDSMAHVSFIIYASTEKGISLIVSDIEQTKTVSDLYNLVFASKEDKIVNKN